MEGNMRESTSNEDTLVGEAMLSKRNGKAKKQDGRSKQDQQASSKKIKNEQKLKRPMNAFMVWSSLERKRLAEREPHLHNTELSKRLGEIWKGMSEDMKKPHRDEAQKLKAKLMEEHPDYKYRPRRRKDIVNLRNSAGGIFAPSGSYIAGQPTAVVNNNDYMRLYTMNNQLSSQIAYATRNIQQNNFVPDKGYMFPFGAATYVPQAPYPALQIPHPIYTGGYITAHGQGPSGSQFLSYQNSPGIIGQHGERPALASNDVYKDEGHVNNSSLCHTVCSSDMPNLQNHPQHQLGNEHNGEYSVATSSKHDPSIGCDKKSFTHHTLANGDMGPIQQSHLLQHHPHHLKLPYSSSAIETPPCSPCVSSNSIQTYSNTVSNNCTLTKVCTSPHDKQCPVSSPLSDGQANKSLFSLVTPSPDNITPNGPSPSSEDPYSPEYYAWNQQMYANSFQVKADTSSINSKGTMYSKPDSIPLYHSEQDVKPVLYSVECGMYDYQDRSDIGNSYYQTKSVILDNEDSLSSSTSSQVLSHDPVGYHSAINGGICDIPTPELTPTDNKCTVMTGDRNMFF